MIKQNIILNNLIQRYDGNKYILKEYFFIIILFLFFIGLAIYQINIKGDFEEVFLSSAFDEEVIDIYQERRYLYLLNSNKINRIKLENSKNYNYNPLELSDFLEKNDRIIKEQCSDTLYVERNSKRYIFLIGGTIYDNEEKQKEYLLKYNSNRTILNELNDCNE